MKRKFLKNGSFAWLLCAVALYTGGGVQPLRAEAPQETKNAVTGIVSDADGPIIGASVIEKGNPGNGTATDVDGKYTLRVSPNATLAVSYLGYATQEVPVGGRTSIDITLTESRNNDLEEVVVTGYGTFKKSAYAGSASVIKASKLSDVPVTSLSDLLQGNASGVSVSSGGSSVPGAPSAIRIRGIGSFNASSSPLFVIDGVPVLSGDVGALSGISSSSAGTDIMATLNTSDIESIVVIKDAAAASLYGSRAANGVIVITTKSGAKGKPAITLKADMGFSDFAMPYRAVMGGQERRDMYMEGFRNEWAVKDGAVANAANYTDVDDYVAKNIEKNAPVPWSGFTDWDKVLFKTGTYKNYETSVSGGNESGKYYASLNYTDQDGVTSNSGLERVSARLNADYNVTKKFTVGVKSLVSRLNQDVFSEGTVYVSPFYSSRRNVTPSDAVYLADGSYNHTFVVGSDRNPKIEQDLNYKREALTRAFNTVYGQYEFIDNLKFKSTFSYDYNLSKGDTYNDPRSSEGKSSNGSRSKLIREYQRQVWSNALTYDFSFLDNHHVDALAAVETESYDRDYIYGNKTNYLIPEMDAIGIGGSVNSINGYLEQYRLASLVSRVNWNYLSKYYAGVSYRYDGSSRLPRNVRWGGFWSLSGAWRISDESFMESVKPIISDLKLRVSYGSNGTLPSDYYGYLALSSLSSTYVYQGNSGIAADQVANDDLRWEKNYNTNIAVDLGLLDRINLSVEFYNRTTSDLLMNLPISATTGFTTFLGNVGQVRNRGIEAEITSQNIDTKDFRWTTNFNIGHNANKILKWDGVVTESVSGNFIRKVGSPRYTYYLYEFAGIDPADGEAMFYMNTQDENGKIIDRSTTKTYTEASRIAGKSPEPKVSGGLNNTFSYKWFDLSFLANYQLGGYNYDNGAQKLEHGGGDLTTNIPSYYNNRWQNPGDVTDIERFVANRATPLSSIASTRRLHSSDMLRLKNLTFGVRLPKEWIKSAGLESVRVYAAGSNLLTWSKWDWYDPEAAMVDGYVEWTQPPMRTVTFGIDIKF
ncbi:SusC/RagA family TonB-linked outer membrane protein [Bacteroidia bacterium]|nr:SusC/RagA family TonB-linked outer membrane protein [Bacteroidia bacterium]